MSVVSFRTRTGRSARLSARNLAFGQRAAIAPADGSRRAGAGCRRGQKRYRSRRARHVAGGAPGDTAFGAAAEAGGSSARRPPPRRRSGTVDRCERARADRSRERCRNVRAQPVSLPADLREGPGCDPAPISDPLPAAPGGAAIGVRCAADHRGGIRGRIRRLVQLRAHVPPRRRGVAARFSPRRQGARRDVSTSARFRPPPRLGSTAMSLHREVPERVEDRLIVALDVPSIGEARALLNKLDSLVSFFKVGLWLQFAAGFDGLLDELIRRGKKIFLDAKMFDIGETVKQGVERAAERGVSFVTVHGDGEIMRAAVEGRGNSRLKVLAITVLTSLDEDGLHDLGYQCSVEQLIRHRVRSAIACGCDGIVAAPRDDLAQIRQIEGADRLLIATPGVRLAGASADDHKRTGTPAQAIAAGADYLVVGRPIVKSGDPALATRQIIEDMRRAT